MKMRIESGTNIGRNPDQLDREELMLQKYKLAALFVRKLGSVRLKFFESVGYDVDDLASELFRRAEKNKASYNPEKANYSTFYFMLLNRDLFNLTRELKAAKRGVGQNLPLTREVVNGHDHYIESHDQKILTEQVLRSIFADDNPLGLTEAEKIAVKEIHREELSEAAIAKLLKVGKPKMLDIFNSGMEKIKKYLNNGHKK